MNIQEQNTPRAEQLARKMGKDQLVEIVKTTAMALSKAHKAKEKSSNTELNSDPYQTRAKATTNYANSFNCDRMYRQHLDDLTMLVRVLGDKI